MSGRLGAFARRWAPWLAGFAILALLFVRVPLAAVRAGLAGGAWGVLALYSLPFILATLAADAYATAVCLRLCAEPRPLGTLFWVRGATYLLGLLNYALGQGGIGFYLHRTGVRAARGTGIVLFLLIVNLGAFAVAGALGIELGMDGLPGMGNGHRGLHGVALGIAVAGIVYLAVIALRPAVLARREVLAPLFAAGPAGHLLALAGRLPHLFLLLLGHWGAMRLWGLAVPLRQGLLRLPLVLLASVVPLSPAGLGTVQATQILLFAPYSAAATPVGREAAVLSYSLAFTALTLLAQALAGAVSLAVLRRRGTAGTVADLVEEAVEAKA